MFPPLSTTKQDVVLPFAVKQKTQPEAPLHHEQSCVSPPSARLTHNAEIIITATTTETMQQRIGVIKTIIDTRPRTQRLIWQMPQPQGTDILSFRVQPGIIQISITVFIHTDEFPQLYLSLISLSNLCTSISDSNAAHV